MQFEYESENLIYRILDETHYDRVLQFYAANDEAFSRYEPMKPQNFYTEEYQKTTLRLEQEMFLKNIGCRFWVYEKTAPYEIVGCISYQQIVRGCFAQAKIGYKVDTTKHNRGIGTEAVRFSTHIMQTENYIHRIEAYIHPDNAPSIQLAKKCGFIHEGIAHSYARLHCGWTDHERYALIAGN